MARRKNAPESIRVKHGLSERLRILRTEFYGERGGPDLARTLGIPVRTWYNYENGVTVPAEIILRIVELTSVEPVWLLRGEGAKFRANPTNPTNSSPSRPNGVKEGLARSSVTSLLRAALERLEDGPRPTMDFTFGPPIVGRRDDDHCGAELDLGSRDLRVVEEHVASATDLFQLDPVHGEGFDHRRTYRTFRATDDSMAPIVAEGAHVAYSDAEPVSEAFHDKLVVAWIDGTPIVRWFEHCGRFALLRAENRSVNPPSSLVDLETGSGVGPFHRVLWISTPH